MNNSFANDFRYVWNGPNNAIYRLIVINVGVWLIVNFVNLFAPQPPGVVPILAKYLMIPSDPMTFLTQPWSVVTSFFTHSGLWHLFWNMVVLYWFGPLAANFIGTRKVLAAYILSGLAGSILYFALSNTVPYFQAQAGVGALGASAAVNGVLLAAATIAPESRLHLLFLGPVKLKYIALVVVVLALFGLRGDNTGGELAHLGGAAMGFLFIRNLQQGRDWSRWVLSILDWFQGLTKKGSSKAKNIKVSYRKGGKAGSYSENYESKSTGQPDPAIIDAILDKISESGYDKLTAEEKKILFRASQHNKK